MFSNGNRALVRRAAPQSSESGDYTGAEPNSPLSPRQAHRTLTVFSGPIELGVVIDNGRTFEAITPNGRCIGRYFPDASAAALALDRLQRRVGGTP